MLKGDQINNRKYIYLIGFLVVLIAIAVIVSKVSRTPATKSIRVIGEAISTVDAIDKIKGEFTKETGINVVVEKYEFESALEKSTLDVATKAGTYDIYLQYGVALGRFASQDALLRVDLWKSFAPVEPGLQQDLFQNVWHALSWYKGTAYGYPFAANTMYVWYRKDLLNDPSERVRYRRKYGYDPRPPRNWKDFKDLAEFFTRPEQGFYGTAIQGKRHPAVWYEWLNYAYSFGGGVFEKANPWEYGPIIINSPASIAATEYYKSLIRYSPPGTTNFTWDDVQAEMQQGRIFMCIMWSDSVFTVEDPKSSKVAGKLGYCPLPLGAGGPIAQIAGGSYFIPRYSRHQPEAAQFVMWLLKRRNQVLQQVNGGASALKSVYEDPRVNALPYTAAHLQSLAVGRHMTDTFPEEPKVGDIIQIALSDILVGKKSVQEGLDWAALELNRLLGDKCPIKYPPHRSTPNRAGK